MNRKVTGKEYRAAVVQPDGTAVAGAAASRALLQQRIMNGGQSQRFPDFRSYARYQRGVVITQNAATFKKLVSPPVILTVPGAPTDVVVTASDGRAIISFSTPTSNGGAPILYYKVTSSPDGLTVTGTESPITITGLTNDTSYTFTVVATNSVGDSSASAISNVVTPGSSITTPYPPTDVIATAGNRRATIRFSTPSYDGGSPIISYTVTSDPDGITVSGTGSPIIVNGLENDTEYTFTVVATNSVGDSAISSTSNVVIPANVPDTPINVIASAGDRQVTLTFSAPANNGGSPILSYTVRSEPGGFSATGTGSPITVTGLTNGTNYTFTLVATNANGDSEPAYYSKIPARTIPGSTSVVALAGDAEATVTFNPPNEDTYDYHVISTPDNITGYGSSSPITVTGLTNGTEYTFIVYSFNISNQDDSVVYAPSEPSNSVTPRGDPTRPDAPKNVSATVGNARATITFTAPANDGGSPILFYRVTSTPGGFTAQSSGSPITVTGLTNGTAYTFTVVATNSVGDSVSSIASTAVTPNIVLTRTVFTSVGNGTWTAPANVTSVNYLVVGGGGGGGAGHSTGAGGGGGGGSVFTGSLAVTPGTSYNYTVGAGGSQGLYNTSTLNGSVGGVSVFSSITAAGGGLGYNAGQKNASNAFGRGGDAQNVLIPTTGGSGGNVRDGGSNPDEGAGGGGGGAGGPGATSVSNGAASGALADNARGGAGGAGIKSNLQDGSIEKTYGQGGKGADEGSSAFISSVVGASGVANTGNGGGGGSSHRFGGNGANGGSGGSGIIVLVFEQ